MSGAEGDVRGLGWARPQLETRSLTRLHLTSRHLLCTSGPNLLLEVFAHSVTQLLVMSAPAPQLLPYQAPPPRTM